MMSPVELRVVLGVMIPAAHVMMPLSSSTPSRLAFTAAPSTGQCHGLHRRPWQHSITASISELIASSIASSIAARVIASNPVSP
jgi:hypothetical protein